jgi:arylamine N-acetyltransferase
MRPGTPLDTRLRDAYLARLGWSEVPPPTLDTLIALHRAHVELVPYETVWIAFGDRRGIDLVESAGHLVDGTGAGGYCYHLNGALSLLLEWLGFDVHRHLGGVQPNPSGGADAPAAGANGNHLALTVSGVDGDSWIVDAGLGDAVYEPIRLAAGPVRQHPFTFHLRPSDAEPGGWRLDHRPGGSFQGFDYRPGPVDADEFAERHEFLSTSPASGFVRVVTAQRRDAAGVDVIRGRVLTRIGAGPDSTREIGSEREWREALGDVFGMSLAHRDASAIAAVWQRICAAHEAFLRDDGSSG